MDQEPLRRDRAWSRPERATAPTWPSMSIRIFVVAFAVLLVLSALYAGSDYATAIIRGFRAESPTPPPDTMTNEPMYFPSRPSRPAEPEPVPIVTQSEPLPPTNPSRPIKTETPSPSSSAVDPAKIHAKGQQRLAVTSGQSALKAISEWIEEQTLWKKEVESLLTSDDGRRIAGDVALLDQFQVVISEERPDPEMAEELQRVVNETLEPLRQVAENENDYSATPAGIDEAFKKYRNEAIAARDSLRKLRARANSIRQRAIALDPSSKTLETALADRQVELATLEVENRTRELAKDREVAAQMRIEAEREALRIQAEQEAAAIVAKAEKEKLIARAKSREVQRLLTPFISNGYMQYRGSYVRDAVEGPLSYKGILDSGALDPTIQGLAKLNHIALDPRGIAIGNDRPGVWNYAGYPAGWSKSDQDYMRQVQDLLRELGPTLVELKMLAP